MTKAQAKKYSLMKWKYLMKTGEYFLPLERFGNINNFPYKCGLCKEYLKDNDNQLNFSYFNTHPLPSKENCKDCPLFLAGEYCLKRNSYHSRWEQSKTKEDRKVLAMCLYYTIESL